jgi:DNA-binding Lrp family transcriptional regulator
MIPEYYDNYNGLAKRIGVSVRTVQSRVKEMEDSGNYGRKDIIRDGRIIRIRTESFMDYLSRRGE